jgi:phage tail-like protein
MATINQYQLRIVGPDEIRVYPLPPGGKTIIGYSPNADIFLNDRTVSGVHAQVDDSSGDFTLTDLESTNGTLLQSERLIPKVPFPLRIGETFRIGRYALTFDEQRQPDDWVNLAQESATPQRLHLYPYTAEVPPGLSRYSLSLLNQLPALYQMERDVPAAWDVAVTLPDVTPATFLSRFLALFEATLLPIEWLIANFDFYLDPQTAPVDFFPWLESWYGLPLVDGLSDEQRRRLLCHAHELYDLKGSRTALIKVIELCTGCTPIVEDQRTAGAGFRVELPAISERPVDHTLVEQLIVAFKPVNVPYEFKK